MRCSRTDLKTTATWRSKPSRAGLAPGFFSPRRGPPGGTGPMSGRLPDSARVKMSGWLGNDRPACRYRRAHFARHDSPDRAVVVEGPPLGASAPPIHRRPARTLRRVGNSGPTRRHSPRDARLGTPAGTAGSRCDSRANRRPTTHMPPGAVPSRRQLEFPQAISPATSRNGQTTVSGSYFLAVGQNLPSPRPSGRPLVIVGPGICCQGQ
jgi:hypothetical protein